MQKQRIDQILSHFGFCSRSDALSWCRKGHVTDLEGNLLRDQKLKVLPSQILVDGEALEHPEGLLIMLNKPEGYVSTHAFEEGPRIYDLLPAAWMQRRPRPESIGRLDKDATGLILITDCMPLLHLWTSPKKQVEKQYRIEVDGRLTDAIVTLFASGTLLLNGETKPCLPAQLVITGEKSGELTIAEGRYHQVKRMFAAAGLHVERLHRLRFAGYHLGDLAPGAFAILPLPSGGQA